MIATSSFVFLHLHKSGGTFVNECLLRFVPGARQVGYHLPRHLIPPESAALPVFGLVRNPWSYYVSWYSFQAARDEPNALFRVLSEERRLGFKGTVRNLLDLGTSPARLARVVDALPAAYGNRGINLPGFALAPIRGSGLGFYSYLYRYMFGDDDLSVTVGRMESLRQDLPRMLESAGQPVTADMRDFIETAPPRNAASHPRYTELYDDELRKLVAERDAPLMTRHGFRFGE
ncbi:MAG TPA: hypothetical protein VJ813_13320 [Vicinamibacterales bacterium]|nr:hypothetical protein [Vicinamibacterales bacterium]